VSEGDVTRLLGAAGGGDRDALQRLYVQVYEELRRLAESRLRREGAGHTLQATALVNEAYLRLDPTAASWENRRHFFGAAAQAMRRILVDHARQKLADKRMAPGGRVTLADLDVSAPEEDLDLLAVNEALDELAVQDPRLAEVVSLRFFAGMSVDETAQALDVSTMTVKRDWAYARAWLCERIGQS
jgi:RNA polymerase sigma factor (TIGR02999 family)